MNEGRLKKFEIVALCVLAASAYGIVHDQITVRLCLEYFTIAHPPIFPTKSPTLLALCWGIAATAGLGAVLGLLLALVSQDGDAPALPVSRIARSLMLLLAAMAASAFIAAIVGYELSRNGVISIPRDWATALAPWKHDRFMAVWFAHCASYLIGLTGAALLCLSVWERRGRPAVITLFPRTRTACLRAAIIFAAAVFAIWFRLFAR